LTGQSLAACSVPIRSSNAAICRRGLPRQAIGRRMCSPQGRRVRHLPDGQDGLLDVGAEAQEGGLFPRGVGVESISRGL
jgi:hypothetical protein